jgi:hypothetical protein
MGGDKWQAVGGQTWPNATADYQRACITESGPAESGGIAGIADYSNVEARVMGNKRATPGDRDYSRERVLPGGGVRAHLWSNPVESDVEAGELKDWRAD